MSRVILDVNDIFKYCEANNIKMLTNYDSDFWEVYRYNSDYFDRLFRNSYKHFIVYSHTDAEDIDELVAEWVFDVLAFLKLNDKRYSELWRLQDISDTDYSILDNYNVRESHMTAGTVNRTDTMGSKTNSSNTSTVHGQQSISETNSFTHGAKSESDSETMHYGQDSTTTSGTLTVGQQSNTREEKVSADNVATYSPKNYTEDVLGTRQDSNSETETRAVREDTKTGSHSEQARTDQESKSLNRGSQTDTITENSTIGAHTDLHSTTDNETKTVTRRGNIGVFSASKLLSEHKELWDAFNFYKMIFDEIADEFLRIVY